ncbi:hypothetical protein BASA81_002776 [Batrachochytrium salamandrivorans]|nr:hypothetical protein BASA81_002776 [Batrachochytrium salamandrivorans]
MKLWYFGSDALSLRLLQRLGKQRSFEEVLVVTPPDRPQGRSKSPSPCVLKLGAKEMGLRVIDAPGVAPRPLDLDWDPEILSSPKPPSAVGIVFSFGYFMPKPIIDSFGAGGGMVNLHPSLLPRYRGASPIQHALMNHDSETGVSLIKLHESKFDCGEVLKQARIALDRNSTYTLVSESLVDLGGDLLIDLLSNTSNWQGIAQTSSNACFAPKIDRNKLMQVYFTKDSETTIWGKFRALEQVKAAFQHNPNTKVSMFGVLPGDLNVLGEPGDVIFDSQGVLWVKPVGKGWLSIHTLQVEGKRMVTAQEFFNGHLAKLGLHNNGIIRAVFI